MQQDSILPIDHPEVPPELRKHGARFRNPEAWVEALGAAAWVEALGADEFALFASDGELLDLIHLRD